VTEGNKYGDEKEVKKKVPARFDSSIDGQLVDWYIKGGSVIHGPGCAYLYV
jgi:RNA polymerase II subunit A-like phosphatase